MMTPTMLELMIPDVVPPQDSGLGRGMRPLSCDAVSLHDPAHGVHADDDLDSLAAACQTPALASEDLRLPDDLTLLDDLCELGGEASVGDAEGLDALGEHLFAPLVAALAPAAVAPTAVAPTATAAPVPQTPAKRVRRAPPLQASPAKKVRARVGCNCKTGCQKLYCICFRAGVACDPKLCGRCTHLGNCCNTTDAQQPRAKRRTFCMCKKSGCLQKYCECRLAGRACGPDCGCPSGCENVSSVSSAPSAAAAAVAAI